MNTQLKNYWSLYMDFLNDFEDLTYDGYSISYLFCNFYSLVSNNSMLWNSLSESDFKIHLKREVNDQREIQEAFDQFIHKHKCKSLVKIKNGITVFHKDKLLRISRPIILRNFNPDRTIILQATLGRSNDNISPSVKKKESKKNKVSFGNHIIKKIPPSDIDPNKKYPHRLHTYYLSEYSIDIKNEVIQLQNKAREIFASHKNHLLYQDPHFQKNFLKMLPEIIGRIEQTKRFLSDKPISCVVVSTTHSYINRILALVAAKKGIPSICLQHGIIASEFGYIPKIATIDAVYGDFEVDWYKKLGVSRSAVEIIGHPRFDQALSKPKMKRNQFNRRLGLSNNKPTLMIVIRDIEDESRWRKLIKTIKKLDLNIIIKNYPRKTPHPLTKEFPFVQSTADYSVYDIFPHVDAVVSYASTVGLEAMLANKPVFILNRDFVGYTEYYETMDQLIKNDPKVLGQLIVNFFTVPSFHSYVLQRKNKFIKYAYPDLSNSGERLKKLVARAKSGRI